MSIDLHIHSTFSDGTMSPGELVVLAKKKGLKAISITDHDTVDGVVEAIDLCVGDGFEVIPGVEIGAKYSGITIHILGYLFDQGNVDFKKSLEKLQVARNERNGEILLRLKAAGIDISDSELRVVSRIGQTGRPHIAKILLEKGIVKTTEQAFSRFLRKGAEAYVPRFLFTAEEVFSMIRQAGGISVLAHPLQLQKTGINLTEAIEHLASLGMDGLETYYPTHSKKTRTGLVRSAAEFNLVLTGGSDFHGSIRPGTTLAGGKNVTVPYALLEEMKKRALNNSMKS
ncbi:MAG: PHP domain-containing protein [Desulfobulbaceae bacterium]|nr:PHP domain-containing protein [Desulfobulbaceae bacterium]